MIRRKAKLQNQPELVQPLIGTLTGVVLVLVIGFELNTLPSWKRATRVKGRRSSFLILTLLEDLGPHVRRGVIGVECEPPLNSQSIAVASGKLSVLPI
jgi:hypothetical protein